MEIARRVAESGRRTALVCFNQLVGDWLRAQVQLGAGPPPNLITGRAIRIMAEMTGVTIPKVADSRYWDQDLPAQLEERLTDPNLRIDVLFDYLVVDEAQDLLARPALWGCLTQFLDGGIAGGSYCLLGDFGNQVLGERQAMDDGLAVIRSNGRPAAYRLSENCRNYRIVGDSAVRLSGLPKDAYSGYMRSGGGLQNYTGYDRHGTTPPIAQRTHLCKRSRHLLLCRRTGAAGTTWPMAQRVQVARIQIGRHHNPLVSHAGRLRCRALPRQDSGYDRHGTTPPTAQRTHLCKRSRAWRTR